MVIPEPPASPKSRIICEGKYIISSDGSYWPERWPIKNKKSWLVKLYIFIFGGK